MGFETLIIRIGSLNWKQKSIQVGQWLACAQTHQTERGFRRPMNLTVPVKDFILFLTVKPQSTCNRSLNNHIGDVGKVAKAPIDSELQLNMPVASCHQNEHKVIVWWSFVMHALLAGLWHLKVLVAYLKSHHYFQFMGSKSYPTFLILA